jgi:hypothetical protein
MNNFLKRPSCCSTASVPTAVLRKFLYKFFF